ncbi:MAG: response regulator [Bdellovibrionales bacterium]
MSSLTLIEINAEDVLYAQLVAQGHQASMEAIPDTHFLQCRFFQIGQKPDAAKIAASLSDISFDEDAAAYACTDGDLIFKWTGDVRDTTNAIKSHITEQFGADIQKYMQPDEFFIEYDLLGERLPLKAECMKKLKKQTKQAKQLVKYFTDESLITTFCKVIQLVKTQRAFRAKPHILIIEDQIFSQKMLTSILKDYTCYIAGTAADGVLQYMEKCPDIVFLDIELPDMSGHNFAKLVDRIDDSAYVIIVSGNKYEHDIKAAKENNVKGFIAKPYQKKAILDVIEQYKKARKRKAV